MLGHGLIKIEPEDIEYEAENVSLNQQQQIKDEDDLLDINVKFEVTELETAEDAHINFNTNRYSENKNIFKYENKRNCKNVPISRRQSSNSACSKDSIVDSDNVNTKSCCNICFLYKQQKIVLNCKFCDLNFSDVGNTKSHLHDVQKIFHLIDDISQENAPQKSHVAKAQTNCDELLDYCGNILKLKHREFFIVCGRGEVEYAMDLFERHVPHHEIFEQSRIKSETSRETADATETYGDTTILPELIKQEKETVMDTIQPTPSTNYNKIKQEDSTSTDLEADFLKTITQKTAIVLEESCLQDQCYRDQIKEEFIVEEQTLLEPFHEDQFQQSIKQFNCTLCGLPFLNEKDVSLHMRHCVDRPFKCPECSKRFTKKCSLKRHLQGHTGEKRFACDICNKCFKTTSNLGDHKRIHMGEAAKRYECECCGKKFLRNSDRKNHFRTHTGERPFACDLCTRRFATYYSLRDHYGRYHPFADKKLLKKNNVKQPMRIISS